MPQETRDQPVAPDPSAFQVLVVDDDENVRQSICDLVKAAGYRVTGVASGQEALDLVQKASVDLVLTDLMMPGMTGWQLLRAVKSHDSRILVVVFTGYISDQGEDILMDRGADGYLVKPIDFRRLGTLLRALLFPNNLGRDAEVVVIDDDQGILKAIQQALGSRGLFVVPFSDPDEAVHHIEETTPDLIIIDLHLPGVNGLDLCQTLRFDPATATLPILVITAQASREDVKRGIDLHVNGFVVKPFDPSGLAEKAVQVLRQGGKGVRGAGR